MKAVRMHMTTILLTVLLASCSGQQRQGSPKAADASADAVKILSLSPDVATAFHPGQNVSFSVDLEYSLATAQSGTITLVIQRGEQQYEPLANETRVIQKGSGKLSFKKQLTVPETSAILLFTPLTVQGGTSTSVVDTRAYAVAPR
jgi:hypothetical protein